MNNKGYAIKDIIIVIAVFGIIILIMFSKASYALPDVNKISKKANEVLITKSAIKYGESIIDTLKKENIMYVTGNDLKIAGYLVDDENRMNSFKVKITYNEEDSSVKAEIVNE